MQYSFLAITIGCILLLLSNNPLSIALYRTFFSSAALLFVYIIFLLLLYSVWTYLGIKYLTLPYKNLFLITTCFGSLRVLISILFVLPTYLLGAAFITFYFNVLSYPMLGSSYDIPYQLSYLSVYIPIKWFSWSLLELAMNKHSRSISAFIIGPTLRSRWWRLGGTLLSCLIAPLVPDLMLIE